MRKRNYIFIAIFSFIGVFSTMMVVYININSFSQTTLYTTGFKENDEFIWEIKYIDHSKINASYFWESFTDFDSGAKMKIKFYCVRKINNDTKWSIFYSEWDWTSEPFKNESHSGLGYFAPIVPEPWLDPRFWRLYIFTPCNKYLSALFSSNPHITFHNNVIYFNVSNYTIERIFDYSTGILSCYRIYLGSSLVFLSELL